MKATDWRWEKSRKCEKQEMEAPAAFQNIPYYYYRVKAVPQYIFYQDQYYGTGWHIQDVDLNEVATRGTKAECVWWVLAHK